MNRVIRIEDPELLPFCDLKVQILSIVFEPPMPQTFYSSIVCALERHERWIAIEVDVWCIGFSDKMADVSKVACCVVMTVLEAHHECI